MSGLTNVYLTIILSIFHLKQGYVVRSTGKPASASSAQSLNPPSKAVDGDRNTDWPNMFHSEMGATSSWWQVDLEEEVFSPLITIFFRVSYTDRRNGIRISLSNSPSMTSTFCHTVQGAADGSDIPAVYNVTCEGQGRHLTLSTVTSNDGRGAVMDFGEVEVYACSANTFGPNCDAECHCLNGTCDTVTGECFSGCLPGWMTSACDQPCTANTFGPDCDAECHCLNGTCDTVTGECSSGCLPGWTTSACDQLVSAADVSVFLKYLPVCHVMVTFELTAVSMTTLVVMEDVSMETRIDCMHVCDALPLCTAFQYSPSNSCSLWMPGSSSLSGAREMWKKKS